MTDDRSLERAARSWLEIGPTTAPERAVDAALHRIQTLNQERDLRIPWRLPKMFTPVRLVAIALVGALVLGGVLFVLGGGGRPSTVLQPPGPTPSTTPSRSASPSSAVVRTEAPVRMKGDWEAVVTAPITPYAAADDAIQWSIDWSEGIGTWLQTSNGDQVMRADSVTAQPGEIHLVSTDGQAGGCSIGDDGRYTWSRSTDGLFLTLTKVEDACAARAAVLARTWVHPLDAVNDGGPGVLGFTNHWLQVTLPSVTLALSGASDASDVHAYSGERGSIRLVVIRNPRGFVQPCSASDHSTKEIPPTKAGFISYLTGLPGLTVKTTDSTVDGRPAVHFETTHKRGSAACASGDLSAFHANDALAGADGEFSFVPADPHSFWMVNVDGDAYLIWYEGSAITPSDEQAVISSAKFLIDLPTP